jgi:hypothetical protein
MKFNPDTHNTQTAAIGNTKFQTSVWIRDWVPSDSEMIAAIISVETGTARLQESLSAANAQSMIDMLTQHIEHIKEAELELIAIDTKAAA